MTKQKKCYHCLLATSICQCFNFYFYNLYRDKIEQVTCSNKKIRTVIKGSHSKEALLFLKKRLGCGGNWFKDKLEIQGKHSEKILSEIDNF